MSKCLYLFGFEPNLHIHIVCASGMKLNLTSFLSQLSYYIVSTNYILWSTDVTPIPSLNIKQNKKNIAKFFSSIAMTFPTFLSKETKRTSIWIIGLVFIGTYCFVKCSQSLDGTPSSLFYYLANVSAWTLWCCCHERNVYNIYSL